MNRPDLDLLPSAEIVRLLLDAEQRVVPAVRQAQPVIAAAAELLASGLRAGGRLVFVGAGTSGRIALAEAAELPGTFGMDRSRIQLRIAGGATSTDAAEDDLGCADRDLRDLALCPADVLVAVAASGSTPYTLRIGAGARKLGVPLVSVTTAVDSPLAALASVAIELEVGAEVLRGSTRLTAGTAQKIALNALTTAAFTRLGRVHGDLMIDVEQANVKLRARAAEIVAEIAGRDVATADQALTACGDSARAAVLHLVLGIEPADAKSRAAEHATLRDAMVR